jgi:hypothetical protein
MKAKSKVITDRFKAQRQPHTNLYYIWRNDTDAYVGLYQKMDIGILLYLGQNRDKGKMAAAAFKPNASEQDIFKTLGRIIDEG